MLSLLSCLLTCYMTRLHVQGVLCYCVSVSESVQAMEVCQPLAFSSGFDVFDVNQNVLSPILSGMVPAAAAGTVAPANSAGLSVAFTNHISALISQVEHCSSKLTYIQIFYDSMHELLLYYYYYTAVLPTE